MALSNSCTAFYHVKQSRALFRARFVILHYRLQSAAHAESAYVYAEEWESMARTYIHCSYSFACRSVFGFPARWKLFSSHCRPVLRRFGSSMACLRPSFLCLSSSTSVCLRSSLHASLSLYLLPSSSLSLILLSSCPSILLSFCSLIFLSSCSLILLSFYSLNLYFSCSLRCSLLPAAFKAFTKQLRAFRICSNIFFPCLSDYLLSGRSTLPSLGMDVLFPLQKPFGSNLCTHQNCIALSC